MALVTNHPGERRLGRSLQLEGTTEISINITNNKIILTTGEATIKRNFFLV
jgi:hypothetical protein